MFQKPTFGSTSTSGFGSFNSGTTTSSPFGGFKPAAGSSAFSATPAFGSGTATQPTTGGLFGSANTSGGLFGGTASTSTGGWGSTNTGGFGFGSTANSGNTLFGNTTNTGLFSTSTTSNAFGAKPAGFGFGSTTTNTAAPSGGLFGSTPSTGTGLFGQQNTTLGGGGGLFSNTSGAFGQQQAATGTGHVKYNPVVGTDVMVKSGTSQNVNIKHHCITCMKEYENKSLEELRLEDYVAGRKGVANNPMFGGFAQTTENKPLFGATGGFGQPATTSATGVFGGGGLAAGGGFGGGAFSFGASASAANAGAGATAAQPSASGGLFGANKPAFGATPTAGTGLFGATTTQAPAFGTSTSTFGFGTNTQTQQTGLFGAKPTTGAFGATSTSGFGAFGTGSGLFGNKPTQAQPQPFGTAAPAFGNISTGFGTNTSTTGGLFGNNSTFGKPATSQPAFGFGTTQPTLGGGLGANAFQTKPTATPFGGLGANSMFQTAPPNNTFQTNTGLGGGLFNSSSLGGSALGGMPTLGTNTSLTNNTLSGSAAVGNVHEQMLNLAARPYGDSPLFKDLLPDTSLSEEALKPTNPVALKAVLARTQGEPYRVCSPPGLRLRLQPRTSLTMDKRSLFDGLEEYDPTLEDKLSLKPSRKRLVLRKSSSGNDSRNDSDLLQGQSARSVDENTSQRDAVDAVSSAMDKENINSAEKKAVEDFPNGGGNNDQESSAERNGSWLSSSKLPWSDKEKSTEEEASPRLYPILDKELQNQVSERRASWLTTKMLRKPLSTGNPEAVEVSVRELGVRREDSQNKENVNTQIEEEENVAPRSLPPHPTGVKLTRPGYYTMPSLDEMMAYMRPDGKCVVPHLIIGRRNYGNIYYEGEMEVGGLDLDSLVHFLNKEVIVYPEEAGKPPLGEGLNRRAIVTLDRVWPTDKSQRKPITDPDRLLKMNYEAKLRRVCDKHGTKFIEYRPETGSWVFRVDHFSKYGLTDSDEEDDIIIPVVNQALQKSAAPAPAKPPATVPSTAVPTLGGIPTLGGAPAVVGAPGLGGLGLPTDDSLFAMHQSSLNLFNGASKAFEMDTNEDNGESQSFYQDNRAFGVKSPTGELARLEQRHSHSVQLMKASLYADTDLEDDASVSTGDQLVPILGPTLTKHLARTPTVLTEEGDMGEAGAEVTHMETDEVPMRPLLVHPHTIVLKYHRKVPPFKKTIAGRLDAAYIADMAVSRARHSRVGFGPSSTLAYVTSYDSVNDLPSSADLSNMSKYVSGRGRDDWSESVVTRIGIGQPDDDYNIKEVMSCHLSTLLEFTASERVSGGEGGACPQASVRGSPPDRRALLDNHLRIAQRHRDKRQKFGVSGEYCYEVWKLCEALWGADLDNDGIPGTDELSVVNRHRRLVEWFGDAVADVTDKELATPTTTDNGDVSDAHSARVWTLLLGGRILEACKVSKDNGDLNMAMLIAQASGDPLFRGLLSRQLWQWAETESLPLVSPSRLASLRLLAGEGASLHQLHHLDWLRAMHATARYLCPQVPTLEQIIKTYEGFFTVSSGDDDDSGEGPDLGAIGDESPMRPPLPDYVEQYDMYSSVKGKKRRALDLRYELLRARALNARPRLTPEAYSPDPFDYTLCFLLGSWFGSASQESVEGLAHQLEALDCWHLAVQVLTHHPLPALREHLIKGVLSRHAPARVDSEETKRRLHLVERLRVPKEWVCDAQAHRARYEHNPALEAEYLVGAGQWNAAHKVLLEELLPEAVLADDLQSISPLLEKMFEASKRHEVSGWETGGKALYHYLHVCDEIRGVVCSAEAEAEAQAQAAKDKWAVQARLEALRPALAHACTALGGLQPRSPRLACARAEMGARLVQLALAAEEPPQRLAALLRALRLPPDCTSHAALKITTDISEQASEMCIESATSSPLSSHHKATVAS